MRCRGSGLGSGLVKEKGTPSEIGLDAQKDRWVLEFKIFQILRR